MYQEYSQYTVIPLNRLYTSIKNRVEHLALI